ncbi:MAG TPA: metal-sensitive transcriptional regulator [Dehalococcoidia bacterium]|nr:metal-sensitive transcriptional regulator [Dehalococcoidia bacterium]
MTAQHAETLTAIQTRLRRVEGQVRGILRMLDEGRECEDVLTQLTAVRAGLDQATLALLDRHVEYCVLSGDAAEPERLKQIQRAMRLIARYDASPLPAARDEA